MNVAYSTENGKTEARLSETADWELFGLIAHSIEEHFGGCWLVRLDGLDQRYWDLRVNDVVLTLHLEHYLGISLYPAAEPGDLAKANTLVRVIGAFVKDTFGESKGARQR